MSFLYPKSEKLKSKNLINKLFNEGKSINSPPLRVIYIKTSFLEPVAVKCGVTVGKKHFHSAVDRNRIKRLIREAYRLNKGDLCKNKEKQYALMFLYVGTHKPTAIEINKVVGLLLKKIVL